MDTLTIITLFLSILGPLFVILTQGPDQINKFRESQTTIQRLDKINLALQKELIEKSKKHKNENILDLESNGIIDMEKIEKLEDFGFEIYTVNDITKKLLTLTSFYAKKMIIHAITFSFVSVYSIYLFINGNFTSVLEWFTFISYLLVSFLLGFITFSSVRKYSKTRELFSNLYEEPTISNAVDIWVEL
jgi:hypothetical protein